MFPGVGQASRLPFSIFALLLLSASASTTACESRTALLVTLGLPQPMPVFTPEQAGVIRIAGESFDAITFGVLCGDDQDLLPQFDLTHDFGAGCLDDDKVGTTETIVAWFEPLPESSDTFPCIYGTSIGDDVRIDGLPGRPDATDQQGEGTATWRRNDSPCGGEASGGVEIDAVDAP